MIWLVVILWFLGGVLLAAWYDTDSGQRPPLRSTKRSVLIFSTFFFVAFWPLVALGFVGSYAYVGFMKITGRAD